MDARHLDNLIRATADALGDWWKDDRRNWCAYCGIPMRRKAAGKLPLTLATRDHIIPKAFRGGRLTIPACRGCNSSKGKMSLPEFLVSEHFEGKRRYKHRNQWPLFKLWAVSGLAAFKIALAVVAKGSEPKAVTSNHTR